MPKRLLLVLGMAPAAFLACDGEPSIGITTALPMKIQPPGARESLLKDMCQFLGEYKNEHIKVIWVRAGGGVEFTRTYFCSEVVKKGSKALP